MKTIILKRVASTSQGTFGVLMEDVGTLDQPVEGVPFALTLEPPWKDNLVNISSIPEGTYYCYEYNSPRFGYTYQVEQVPGRTHILFHKGNYTHNTKGCILVGEQFEDDCLRASAAGYKEFMFRLRGEGSFMLNIINC